MIPTKWETRFMDMARLVSTWSKDPSTKVGAVIVDDLNRVLSVGFNGLPHGMSDSLEILENREMKYACTIHAEENAMLFAQGSVKGATMFVYPVPPCGPCAAKVRQVGIKRIVCPVNTTDASFIDRWSESIKASRIIFDGRLRLDMLNFPGYSPDYECQESSSTGAA